MILLNMTARVQDGLNLISRLRALRDNKPLLALTGTRVADRAMALDTNADDAVAEPVDPAELRARITAIDRRAGGFSKSLLTLGDLSLCMVTREVRFQDVRVPLTGREFDVLELMVVRKGTAVTKAMFLSHLYAVTDDPEIKIIDVFMCKLRKKLERAGAYDLIDTVWGVGYMVRDPAQDRALTDRLRSLQR